MVERSLSMREVPGSIPGFSISFFVNALFPFFYFFGLLQEANTLIATIQEKETEIERVKVSLLTFCSCVSMLYSKQSLTTGARNVLEERTRSE